MYINIFFHNFSSSDKMNTRNKIILSGIIAVFLAMSLTTVMAITQPVDTDKDGKDLSVTFLKDCWSFCQDERIVGKGSVPDGESIETAGCAATYSYRRSYSYAFTGEQVQVLVVARDPNGINSNHPLTGVLKVGGQEIGWCKLLADTTAPTKWSTCEHDTTEILDRFPEAFSTISAGFNPLYDRLFQCTLTVQDSDLMSGELGITVEVSNAAGQSGESSPADVWNFNPEVELNIAPSAGTVIMFPQGYAGETVYSTDPSGGRQYLVIKNEGEVDIAVWLGGTDLTSSDGALECPDKNNVLEVEDTMSFQCKVETVKYYDQVWHPVMNKDLTDQWGCTNSVDDMVDKDVPTCYSLCPIFVSGYHKWCEQSTNSGLAAASGPVISGAPMYNIVVAGHPVDCEFRLVYPIPCYMTGSIDTGSLLLLLRAV
jgi:hypothetical protein